MLCLIPTPIGNLEDITVRAVKLLRELNYLLAEDTRHSGRLLKHLEIQVPMRAFHAFNEHRFVENIIQDLHHGMKIGLVTDAGTPGISDPAYLLVRACYEAQIQVTCLPGATALIPAVVMSGIPCDTFFFQGFLPHKKGRTTKLEMLATIDATLVLYESPFRIVKLLGEIDTYLGDREVAVVREISKLHEQVHRGKASELQTFFRQNASKAKGEIVVVIARAGKGDARAPVDRQSLI